MSVEEARRVGLCFRCAHAHRVVSAKGSVFYRCRAPGLPKYPPLPVIACPRYRPRGGGEGGEGG